METRYRILHSTLPVLQKNRLVYENGLKRIAKDYNLKLRIFHGFAYLVDGKQNALAFAQDVTVKVKLRVNTKARRTNPTNFGI